MKTLTFYFALRSPYSALASDMVYEAFSSGAYEGTVNFRIAPFSNRNPDFLDPVSNPLKLKYMMRDLPRLYAAREIPLGFPDPFDIDFSIPARMALAAQENGVGVAFLRSISLMRWSEGRNAADADTLLEAAERVGWAKESAQAALADETLLETFESAITASEEAGVFGVPFFIVSDDADAEPFWGQDRWPMVQAALADA